MRTFLNSNEIASVWVGQTQERGRCSAAMSFDGRNFYSYGTVVAAIVQRRNERVFLVSSWHYSDTTSRHINLVRYAIPKGAKRFEVPGRGCNDYRAFEDRERIMSGWQNEANYLLEQSEKSREPKKTRLLDKAYSITKTMREFASLFKMSLKPYAVTLPLTPAEIEHTVKQREKQDKIARRERKVREELKRTIQRLHPHETITTKKVYAMYRSVQRGKEVSANG